MKWVLIAMLAWTTVATADDLRKPGRVWEFTKYIHGTTEEVRDQLNGELERQLDKQEDAEKLIHDLRGQLAVKNREAVDFTHTRPDYLKLVQEYETGLRERDDLRAELAKARASGTSSTERLDLSARYNRVRLAVEKTELAVVKMVQDAPITYTECIEIREKLKEAEGSLARSKVATEQSAKWRNKLLDATRNSFLIEGPLAADSHGLLGAVTCEKVFDEKSMLVSMLVPWGRADAQDEKEGVTTFSVMMKRVHFSVAGIDTSKLKEGREVVIDQMIEVVKVHFDGGPTFGVTYLAKHVDSDVEDLFKAITPLLSREDRAKRKPTIARPATKPMDEVARLRIENAELKARIAATRPISR